MLNFFKPSPVLDKESVTWLYETFLWAQSHLDADIFYNQSVLVLPSNDFFPGHSDNAADRAQLILDKVKDYAKLQHWPCRLHEQSYYHPEQASLPYIQGNLRSIEMIEQPEDSENYFSIIYNPAQVKNPQAMISYFAQTLAYYLILLSPVKPKDVKENILQLSEVIAVFMGFGVVLANTAFNYKNITCGSCNTPSHDRKSYLSQYDTCYALAIFCVLKGIEKKQVLPFLKKTLHSFFKKAYKEVQKSEEINQFSLK